MSDAMSITGAFEAVVRARPDAPALFDGGRSVSYDALNRAANRLARAIAGHGLPREALVAVHMPRGPRQVVAVLATLKAGAAYLPLDPSHPEERRRLVLDDAACALVLSAGPKPSPSLLAGRAHLDLDALDLPADDTDLDPVDPGALAYAIHTSGSTGIPKGVLVEHRGVVLMAREYARVVGAPSGARHYLFFPLHFDGSVADIFFPLLAGLELVVDPEGPAGMEADELLDRLAAWNVWSVVVTPSYLARAQARPRPGLAALIVAGEPCPPDLARCWAGCGRLVNAYGPTEATVVAAMGEIAADDPTVTIGNALRYVELLLLDGSGLPVADGQIGEIVLAGPALARGYRNRPDLTAAAFVPRFPGDPQGPRMYRTGDLGRRRPDGRFEHCGRLDDQVKIRGVRIEPAEVEAHLRGLAGVEQAVVVAAGEEGDRFLAGFVRAPGCDGDALRRALRARVPPFLVPRIVEILPHLPLLPSGKTDRDALRRFAVARTRPAEPPTAAATPAAALAEIWQDVLARDRAKPNDDFFALGGDSLQAARLVGRVRDRFAVRLPLRALYDAPTFAEFCATVLEAVAAGRR